MRQPCDLACSWRHHRSSIRASAAVAAREGAQGGEDSAKVLNTSFQLGYFWDILGRHGIIWDGSQLKARSAPVAGPGGSAADHKGGEDSFLRGGLRCSHQLHPGLRSRHLSPKILGILSKCTTSKLKHESYRQQCSDVLELCQEFFAVWRQQALRVWHFI